MEAATVLWSATGFSDGMGTLRGRVMPGFLHPAINPCLTPEGAAHAMDTNPPAPLSFPLLPAIQTQPPNGIAHPAGTQPPVCADIPPKEFEIALVIQIFE